jgi:hypothetical protein
MGVMMNDDKLYRTTVKVEVLSRGPLVFEDLADLHDLITNGHFSVVCASSIEEVSKERMRELLVCQRSDPDFFDPLDDDSTSEDE